MNNRIKVLIIGFAILLIGLLAWAAISFAGHYGEAKLVIYVAPTSSSVKLDGHPTKAGKVYTTPGSHTLTGSLADFKDAKQTVTVKKNSSTDVYLVLAPANANGIKYLTDHPDQQKLREQYSAVQINQIQTSLRDKYPILKDLPVNTRRYSIDYGASPTHPDDPTTIALFITAAPEDRSLATDWMKYKGYDPQKFEIIYNTIEN